MSGVIQSSDFNPKHMMKRLGRIDLELKPNKKQGKLT